jgi:hypothetical protein
MAEPRTLILLAALGGVCGALFLIAACNDALDPGVETAPGSEGAGGCDQSPQPMLTLSLSASDGELPADTSIQVKWSAGTEPLLRLDDPSTWKSLEDGSNVICDLGDEPSKIPIAKLTCQLWTSGATQITVEAAGYVRATETFSPEQSERCHGPVPTAVAMELQPDLDAGVKH